MQTVDTNVLVRILIDDPKQLEQVKTARQAAKKIGKLFVPQIVQVEMVWVLESAYALEKIEIIKVLHHLQTNEAFLLQNEAEFNIALQLYNSNNTDFSDCLIWAESRKENYEILTFDKKFSRLSHVKCL